MPTEPLSAIRVASRYSAAPMLKAACIVAAGDFGGSRCLLKNRDRNYTPELRIVHEIRNGVEVLYVEDEITGWIEGINEYGIGIVNAALMVGRDEAEKKLVKTIGKKSKDGERVLKALGEKTLDDVADVACKYKGGLKGHTFVSSADKTYSIENTSKHECVKKVAPKGRIHVRTNHGFEHEDAGYTEGPDYVSSVTRRDTAKDVLDEVKKPEEIAPAVYGERKKDLEDPNNMVRDTDNMRTTSQLVLDLTKKKIYLYLIPHKVKYLGYKNDFPKGYEPKLTAQVFKYSKIKEDGTYGLSEKPLKKKAGLDPCKTTTISLAWVDPYGKVHSVLGGHVAWAWEFVHGLPVSLRQEYAVKYPDEEESQILLKEGWIRVSNAQVVEVDQVRSVSHKAWKGVLEILRGCVLSMKIPMDEEPRVEVWDSSGPTEYSVGDFFKRFGGRAEEDALFEAVMRLAAAQRVARRYHSLGLVKEAREFPSQKAMSEYLAEHPQADPKKHSVREDQKPSGSKEDSEEMKDYREGFVDFDGGSKNWIAEHEITTPGGSYILGTPHHGESSKANAWHKKTLIPSVLAAAEKAIKAGKKVVYLAEGGRAGPGSWQRENKNDPGAEQGQVAEALEDRFGDKVLQDTWDGDRVRIDVEVRDEENSTDSVEVTRLQVDPKAPVTKKLLEKFKDPALVEAGLAGAMFDQMGEDTTENPYVMSPEAKKYLEGKGIDWNSRQSISKIWDDPDLSAIGAENARLRDAEFVRKVRETEASGDTIAIVTPGAQHAYQLKNVLGKSDGKSAQRVARRYSERVSQ